MLYGVHVFARAKVIPDLAISRGEQAYEQAQGDGRPLARVPGGRRHRDGVPGARRARAATAWLDRAAAVASSSPTPLRARRLETWRGIAAARGRRRGRHARSTWSARSQLAAEQRDRPPAVRGARPPRAGGVAPRRRAGGRGAARRRPNARRARPRSSRRRCPGHPPWGAQADAALAGVALARRVDATTRRSQHARPLAQRCSRRITRTCTSTSCCRSRERARCGRERPSGSRRATASSSCSR